MLTVAEPWLRVSNAGLRWWRPLIAVALGAGAAAGLVNGYSVRDLVAGTLVLWFVPARLMLFTGEDVFAGFARRHPVLDIVAVGPSVFLAVFLFTHLPWWACLLIGAGVVPPVLGWRTLVLRHRRNHQPATPPPVPAKRRASHR